MTFIGLRADKVQSTQYDEAEDSDESASSSDSSENDDIDEKEIPIAENDNPYGGYAKWKSVCSLMLMVVSGCGLATGLCVGCMLLLPGPRESRNQHALAVANDLVYQLQSRYDTSVRKLYFRVNMYNYSDMVMKDGTRSSINSRIDEYALFTNASSPRSFVYVEIYVNAASFDTNGHMPAAIQDRFKKRFGEMMDVLDSFVHWHRIFLHANVTEFHLIRRLRVVSLHPNKLQGIFSEANVSIDSDILTHFADTITEHRAKKYRSLPPAVKLLWQMDEKPCRPPYLLAPDSIIFCKANKSDWESLLL